VVVESDRQIPAWVRWVPGLRTAAAGAAIDSHMVKPASEVILQYLFSALNLGLGILLIRVRPHDLAARLLALGMIGTAAVFNFQAHSGLEELPGLALKLHDNYHLFAGLAYVYALLVFPDGKLARSWSRPRWFKWPLRALYLVAITAVVFLNRSRLHGDPTGFVLFFGILIPIAGVTSQVFRLRQASSAAQREQSRVLVWALTLALVTGPLAQRRQRPRRPRITPNTTTATTTMISTHNHVDMAASLIGAGAGQADATAGHPSKQLPASRRPPGPGSTAALRAGSRGPLHPARPARRSGLARRMPARPRPCRATAARS
jgi:hypothetical protein